MKLYDKNNPNYNYYKIFISVFLGITCSILVYFLFSNIKHILKFLNKIIIVLQPIIIGIALAYLLNPVVKRIESILNKRKLVKGRRKLGRLLSILITYLILFILIAIIIRFFIPSLFDSINLMINNIPKYLDNIFKFLKNICSKYNIDSKFLDDYSKGVNSFLKKSVVSNIDVIINNLAAGITNVINFIINIVISIIVSIYLIYDKEMFIKGTNKILKAYCAPKVYDEVMYVLKYIYKIFGEFMVAKIIDSLIIGLITFVVLSIFRIPYALLISLLVAVTNIIPYFGPFMGAIPSICLLLMIDFTKAIEFTILIFIIQQFDGSVLGPKLIGNKMGMKSFWVLFSILLFGGLFGFTGMILAVPLFTCIYEFIKKIVNEKLSQKEKSIVQ